MDNRLSEEACQYLAHHPTLNYLNLSSNQISDEGATVLAQSTRLNSLNLSYNRIGSKGAIALAGNANFRKLNLSYNNIQAEGAAAFVSNSGLKTLLIAGNNISFVGIKTLARNQTLTSLDVSYNAIDDEGAIELAKHPTLTCLDISYNQIGFIGANALGRNEHLTTLIASYNQFGDGGAIAITHNLELKKLELTGNRIGFEGAYALSQHKKLEYLCLSHNQVGDPGAVSLSYNKVLSKLMLSYNQIGDIGAFALAENTTLKTLNLNYNQIGERGRNALQQNKTFSLKFSKEQPPEFTHENLDTIFRLSETFLCILSPQGIIQFFNPAFSRVLGRRSDELLGQSFFKFLHPDDQPSVQNLLNKPEGDVNFRFENRYLSKDGAYRIISWSSQFEHNRIYAIGTDITQKKQSELDFVMAKEKHFLMQLRKAEAFGQQQTEFIAQMSHEVRNPLTGMDGMMDLIQDHVNALKAVNNTLEEASQRKIAEGLKAIEENLAEMQNCMSYQLAILDDNLDTVRIKEKKLILKHNPFDLTQAIRQVISMLQAKAQQKGLAIQSQLPEIFLVKGDAMRVKQILMNLIANAIKFTYQGHIDIAFSVKEANSNSIRCQISIADTGIGLTPEEISNLFKRFSQTVGSEYAGAGLGLYLMQQLANLMGGDISITSEKGKGSILSIALHFETLTEEETQQFYQQKSKELTLAVAQPMSPAVEARLLIVEDNALNQKVLNNQLAKLGYHQCYFASNGQEALTCFDQQTFDVILMDLEMPVMDGITAAYEIRRREHERALSRTPIIAITANVFESDKVEVFRSGMDDFIAKPFKKEEIQQKIAAALIHKKDLLAEKQQAQQFASGRWFKTNSTNIKV